MDGLSEATLRALSAKAAGMFAWTPRTVALPEPAKEAAKPKATRVVSKDALDWLYDLSQKPFQRTTVRDRLLGYSAYRAKKARDELEELGYVRRHVIPTGRRGGQLILEEITDEGYEHLAQMQVTARKPPGRGGYVHKFWQHRVAEWVMRNHEGAKVRIEDAGSGKSVDVSLFLPSQPDDKAKATAFEVLVNGEEKELTNVSRDLQSGYDEVVLCVDRWEAAERLREKIRKGLGEEVVRKVKFQLLAQFLERDIHLGDR